MGSHLQPDRREHWICPTNLSTVKCKSKVTLSMKKPSTRGGEGEMSGMAHITLSMSRSFRGVRWPLNAESSVKEGSGRRVAREGMLHPNGMAVKERFFSHGVDDSKDGNISPSLDECKSLGAHLHG